MPGVKPLRILSATIGLGRSRGLHSSMATLTLAVCARNAQDIIGDCLASVRAQTTAPDEVIVAVDDASDPTIPVAESFGARIVISPSTGLYEARNAVLNACTTDYLAFTDADCVLVPE
ncbi:MAG: glycosyltransferase family 2 protein, partial [Candidatus Hydrogenedentes bacterium]|nr:glycosyltransferase family 2 protein [Candidatus Hydrogenedentota bacterium]